MASTLAELLAPQTVEQIFQSLLGLYSANGFPVQSWQPGGCLLYTSDAADE